MQNMFPLRCNLLTRCSVTAQTIENDSDAGLWQCDLFLLQIISFCSVSVRNREKCNKEGVSPFAPTEGTHAVTQRGRETDRGKWILQRLNHNASLSDSVAYLCNCSSHTQTAYFHSLSHAHTFFFFFLLVHKIQK